MPTKKLGFRYVCDERRKKKKKLYGTVSNLKNTIMENSKLPFCDILMLFAFVKKMQVTDVINTIKNWWQKRIEPPSPVNPLKIITVIPEKLQKFLLHTTRSNWEVLNASSSTRLQYHYVVPHPCHGGSSNKVHAKNGFNSTYLSPCPACPLCGYESKSQRMPTKKLGFRYVCDERRKKKNKFTERRWGKKVFVASCQEIRPSGNWRKVLAA
ncbi:hypothetical protein CEXT_106951 [Caerostris extrusa]|uniref:Transposase n=1 Tax=Caerostris extrusa TaxID=172846 RepID=A0AAV4QH10_CAEEX|nr:hypothetical protein CEXT_106951 [Caerostris extrusa]